jgi:PKD repeat protein
VGRVDLANLTSFTLTETQLMKNYLDKDHDYRKKIFTAIKQGIVDDNFGYMSGEAFAASGYNNMSPLVGTASVSAGDYFTSMAGASYQWSYGCGGGSYTSAGGIGNTTNFAAANLQGVFTMLFGSYFGDWDITNSFLRAPLAQGKILTNVWSGRPHWYFHHMALGENIGYATTLTQNYQQTLYFPNIYNIHGGWIHNGGLMGDPTLRNDIVSPVSNVVAQKSGYDCHISWSASTQTNVLGYNIYRRDPVNSDYIKINAAMLSGTTYTDVCLLNAGIHKYMVRAVVLETSPSGTYYNMSEGIADTSVNTNPVPQVTSSFFGTTNSNTVTCVNSSTNATTYLWNFGDGATSTATNPVHTYTANGNYTITLIASNACLSDTSEFVIQIIGVGLEERSTADHNIELYPNPANTEFTVTGIECDHCTLTVYSSEGKEIFISELKREMKVDVANFRKGLYFVKVNNDEGKIYSKRLIVH